uniref:Uncharacterized protein n=1 Tax=Anguilla anguilla TaxID=7936 RepID=A0A0E9W3C9_ANGAN
MTGGRQRTVSFLKDHKTTELTSTHLDEKWDLYNKTSAEVPPPLERTYSRSPRVQPAVVIIRSNSPTPHSL